MGPVNPTKSLEDSGNVIIATAFRGLSKLGVEYLFVESIFTLIAYWKTEEVIVSQPNLHYKFKHCFWWIILAKANSKLQQ